MHRVRAASRILAMPEAEAMRWTAPGGWMIETVSLSHVSRARYGSSRGHDAPPGESIRITKDSVLVDVVTTPEQVQAVMGDDYALLTEGK